MYTHDVRARKKFILGDVSEIKLFIKTRFNCARRNKHFHIEGASRPANILSNVSEANKPKGSPLDTSTLRKHSFVPVTTLQHGDSFSHAAIDAQYETYG